MRIKNFKDPEKQISKLERKLKKMRARAEEAERDRHELAKRKAAMEEELDDLSRANKELREQLHELAGKIDHLSRDAEGFIVLRRKAGGC